MRTLNPWTGESSPAYSSGCDAFDEFCPQQFYAVGADGRYLVEANRAHDLDGNDPFKLDGTGLDWLDPATGRIDQFRSLREVLVDGGIVDERWQEAGNSFRITNATVAPDGRSVAVSYNGDFDPGPYHYNDTATNYYLPSGRRVARDDIDETPWQPCPEGECPVFKPLAGAGPLVTSWSTKDGLSNARIGRRIRVTATRVSDSWPNAKVTYTWRVGSRNVATGRSVIVRSSWQGKAVSMIVRVTATGATPSSRTISYGRARR